MLSEDGTLSDVPEDSVVPSLADLMDQLRPASVAIADPAAAVELTPGIETLLERCVRDFERESSKMPERRAPVGALVQAASPAQIDAVCAYVKARLGLRLVDIDGPELANQPDEIVFARLGTLTESLAHVVVVRGLDFDVDARIAAALVLSDVDVLVVAFAQAGATFGPGIRRRLKHRIDFAAPDQPVRESPLRFLFG